MRAIDLDKEKDVIAAAQETTANVTAPPGTDQSGQLAQSERTATRLRCGGRESGRSC
jgi:hypothetical protein